MVMVLYRDVRINEKQFQELRLRYAVDYATEAAFMASLEGGNLGITYQDLQNVKINPENTLEVFKSVLALSYDMSLSKENLKALDQYIASAVLVVSDGYYIASLQEVDTDDDTATGGEYELRWGLKKPFVFGYPADNPIKYVAYNISTESWVLVKPSGNGIQIVSKPTYKELVATEGIAPDKENVLKEINKRIADDINYNINRRNEIYSKMGKNDFIYLPASQTINGINAITKPSIFITLSGVDFAGSQKIEAKSVGGFTLAKKRRVLGFVKNGEKYYCYESQIPESELGLVREFFNTVEEAAEAGYRPYLDYLRQPFKN